MQNRSNIWRLLACTAIVSAVSMPAFAQSAAPENESGGLDEIVVTAQKREQSLQDVPIAVTAIGGESLANNRVTNVTDLSGLAPGVTVRVSAGGSKLPIFAIRGQLSYGVVPGSDKQTSIYLDGVYISSPRGSIFDLPDVDRIEVLRGPQGTLFGRNATAGAVSISTRDPNGKFGVRLSGTLGNYDQRRIRVSVDTPEIGPFSAYFSFVHDEKRGDIRNLGAGTFWDRSKATLPRIAKITKATEWLGSKDVNSYFAAIKFESGDFKTIYRYDRSDDSSTPEAVSVVALNRSVPFLGNFLGVLADSNGVPFATDVNIRPAAVANAWSVPTDQEVQGHSLTSTYVASDNVTIKNIFAFRKSYIFATSPIDGMSSLPFTQQALVPYATFIAFSSIGKAPGINSPADAQAAIPSFVARFTPLLGQPFVGISSGAAGRSKQWSDELQVNYNSDFLTATVGALWFHGLDYTAEQQLQNTISFKFVPGGVLPNEAIGKTFNETTSVAAYAQAELHLSPKFDVIIGGRVTSDKKSGDLNYGPLLTSLKTVSFKDSKTRFNYLIGVNYKPTDDMLLYAKYSTAYVSGGSTAGIPFEAETAKSAEVGMKAEFLNRKLRANLAAFWVQYKNVQTPQTATSFAAQIAQITGDPNLAASIGTFVLTTGDLTAKGFEFDFDAAPADGVTIGGSLSYNQRSIKNVPQLLITANDGAFDAKRGVPEWTGSVYAQYKTRPLFGESYLSLRADGVWTDDVANDSNPNRPIYSVNPAAYSIKSYWMVNGRVALRDIDIGGVKTEIALWGRNLFDTQRLSYGLNLSNIFFAGNYLPARTMGVDLTVSF